MKPRFLTSVLSLLILVPFSPAEAEDKRPAFAEELFLPLQIQKHQQQLGISEKQKTRIMEEMKAFAAEAAESRWRIQEMSQALTSVLRKRPASEPEALALADGLLEAENALKKRQLAALIRIRNVLTPEQIQQLRSLLSRQ